MMNEEAMAAWIEENFKANLDVIEDLSYAQIKQMVVDREYVLIYACKLPEKIKSKSIEFLVGLMQIN